MSDPFHHAPPPSWNPFDLILGLGGMLSPWWINFVHGFDALVGAVAFYGGGFLVAFQIWRLVRSYYVAKRGRS